MGKKKISLYVGIALLIILLVSGIIWFSTTKVAVVAGCLGLYILFNLRAGRIPMKNWFVNLFWGLAVACVFVAVCFVEAFMFWLGLIFVVLVQCFAPVWGEILGWNEAPELNVEKSFMDDDGKTYEWTVTTNKNSCLGTVLLCIILLVIFSRIL